MPMSTGDGVVNIDDIVLVAAVVDSTPAAPSIRSQIPEDPHHNDGRGMGH